MDGHKPNIELYKRLVVRFVLAIIYMAVIFFILPRVFKLFHPFIFALIIAKLLNPLVSKIHRVVSKINKGQSRTRKIITLILNLLMLFIIVAFIFYLSYTIIGEIIDFSLSIQQNWGNILEKVDSIQENLGWVARIFPPQVIDFLEGFRESILDFIKNTSKQILSSSITITASIITGAGNLFINVLTFFLAMYFLISDYHIIGDLEEKHSHKSVVKTFNVLRISLTNALGGFFKAQFILAGLAFVFMFFSLKIYGIPHAFVISLFLGFIDLLPIVGTIAILLPWGLIEYIGGDLRKGVFLIIIAVAYTLIRRIIEPKVMGSQIGLHPLLALMSTYVGLKFSGLWGAVLGPLALMISISIFKSGIFTNTIEDFKELYFKISSLLRGSAR